MLSCQNKRIYYYYFYYYVTLDQNTEENSGGSGARKRKRLYDENKVIQAALAAIKGRTREIVKPAKPWNHGRVEDEANPKVLGYVGIAFANVDDRENMEDGRSFQRRVLRAGRPSFGRYAHSLDRVLYAPCGSGLE